jgi:hypothetical protein
LRRRKNGFTTEFAEDAELLWGCGGCLDGLDAEEEEVGEVVVDDDVVGVEGGPGLRGLREPDGDVFCAKADGGVVDR